MIIGIDCSRAFTSEKTGTENYSYYLVKHLLGLPAAGKHTFVLFIRPNSVLPDWTRQKNVTIELIQFRFLWTQLGLAAATWQIPLDRLWIPAHTLPILRKPGLTTMVTIHGLEYQWLPEYKNLLQRWYLPLSTFYAAKYAHKLIAVSQFTKDQLVKELHTSAKKIKVIHEGVELASSDQQTDVRGVLETYGLQDKQYLLFVGTVQPRKNLVALIRAFSQLAGHNAQYRLVIAGGIGWMAEEVLAAPLHYGAQERVIFTGRVNEAVLHVLYRSAALYVQPSLTEGFGLPVLEAMGAGVPVLVSDGGALPEVVARAGIVVKLGAQFTRDLHVAIEQLLYDPTQQKKLVTMGYKRVEELSWNRAAEETLAALVGEGYNLSVTITRT